MSKKVILVTGTPCVGKTEVANMLAAKLEAYYLNLTELTLQEGSILGKDQERDSIIVDENHLKSKISELLDSREERWIIVDGHFSPRVVPRSLTERVFVLRRDPIELRRLMERRGYSESKLWENIASEILDVCLCEALRIYDEGKVCEIDTSYKTIEDTVATIMSTIEGREECAVGVVDWLGRLERERLLEEYLRI